MFGLTVSGGEPLLQVEFARALLATAKDAGLHTCVQTAAALPARNLLDVEPWVDLFQIDLKHMDPARHRQITGSDNAQVHENLERLLSRGARVEVRVPVVPGWNDDADNLEHVRAFLADHAIKAVRLVPYQRMYLDKYRRLGLPARCADVEPPARAALEQVAAWFRHGGIDVALDA
jgi:pyruvate formate lyase activating enzyme